MPIQRQFIHFFRIFSDKVLFSTMIPTRFDFLYQIHFRNPVAVTLTMKQFSQGQWIDEISCSVNLRHFLNRLNKKVFGNGFGRYRKRLQVVAVQEWSSTHRLHLHLIISRPDQLNLAQFVALVRDCWSKTRFGYYEAYFEDCADTGWLDYMLKGRTKSDLADFIDWTNLFY